MGKKLTGALVSTFEQLPGDRDDPLHLRLYRRLRASIVGGSLAPGTRLPSSRTLARDLGVSRNTVEAALSQLDAEGFVERRVGSGTYVARIAPQRPEPRGARSPAPAGALLSTRGATIAAAGEESRHGSGRAFAPCVPGLDSFPIRTWQKLLGRRARRMDAEMLRHPDPAGYRPLREAIAAYVGAARGVSCDWRRVVVFGSTQEALDLSARLLADPGELAWLEDPGYLGARAALVNAGIRPVPVPVDEGGMEVDEGIRRAPGARLAYVTPSHQYPLGYTLSLPRRLALLEWAATAGAWIFEDDYDSEFRYTGRPLAAVQGLDHGGRVLYAGTFSKPLFPALRLAYLIVPDGLVDGFVAARASVSGPVGTFMQAVLADFIADGHFGAHIRAMRNVYQERRVTLLDSLAMLLPERARVLTSSTGLHVTVELPASADDAAVSAQATLRGLDLPPLSRYYLDATRRGGLVINFAPVRPAEIRAGVAALREVLDEAGVRGFSDTESEPADPRRRLSA